MVFYLFMVLYFTLGDHALIIFSKTDQAIITNIREAFFRFFVEVVGLNFIFAVHMT